MMKILRLLWGVVAVLLLTTGTVWAGKYMAGLGAGMAPDYEGSDDYAAVPMLMLRGNYSNGLYFSLMGTNFKFNVIPDERFSFGPSLNYRMPRDNVDNKQVDKMKDVDGAIELGAFGVFNFNNFLLGLEYLTDVSGEHDGTVIIANAGYKWTANEALTITPTIFSSYASEDYMNTYFSVNKDNRGSSVLANYNADAGIKDIGAKVIAHYNPRQEWGIMGVLSYTALLGEAKDSPVVKVGDDNQITFGLLVTYSWDGEGRRGGRRRR